MRLIGFMLLFISPFAHAERHDFKDYSYEELNNHLSLGLHFNESNKANGYYNSDLNGILNGDFNIEYHNVGYADELETNYEFVVAVKGEFKDGNKVGTWIYDYVYDDGVDFYEKHLITIEYNNGTCLKSTFEGVIGHIMPMTKHTFQEELLCDPQIIRNKAEELWGIEYEKKKQAGEL